MYRLKSISMTLLKDVERFKSVVYKVLGLACWLVRPACNFHSYHLQRTSNVPSHIFSHAIFYPYPWDLLIALDECNRKEQSSILDSLVPGQSRLRFKLRDMRGDAPWNELASTYWMFLTFLDKKGPPFIVRATPPSQSVRWYLPANRKIVEKKMLLRW